MTREEAIKIIGQAKAVVLNNGEYDKAMSMAIGALQAEPVKHGTWTITDTDDGEGGEAPHLICSECKSEPMAWSSKRFFNYCPNCGAKMDGQEE